VEVAKRTNRRTVRGPAANWEPRTITRAGRTSRRDVRRDRRDRPIWPPRRESGHPRGRIRRRFARRDRLVPSPFQRPHAARTCPESESNPPSSPSDTLREVAVPATAAILSPPANLSIPACPRPGAGRCEPHGRHGHGGLRRSHRSSGPPRRSRRRSGGSRRTRTRFAWTAFPPDRRRRLGRPRPRRESRAGSGPGS